MGRGVPFRVAEADAFFRRVQLFLLLLGSLLLFGTLSFALLEDAALPDALILTFETLAFMFHDFEGVAKGLQIFLAIFGVFLLWWILWSGFDMLFGEGFADYVRLKRQWRRLRTMENHYIIAGGGRVGDELARRFAKRQPCLIIERDEEKVARIRKEGFDVLKGDVTEKETLLLARIETAKALVIAMPETEVNLLVTLLARELNPGVTVYARADNPEYVSILKKAGASAVVVPELAAVEQLLAALNMG